MDAFILSIGDELMEGIIADTNARFLSERLRELGLRVIGHRAAGDDLGRLVPVLREIAKAADVCVATGGLGPTLDDVTREAFSAAFRRPLEPRPEARRHLEAFFRGRAMNPSNLRQGELPRGAEMLRNPAGTAPGFLLRAGRCRFFAAPGVPSEMTRMWKEQMAPRIARLAAGRAVCVRRLHLAGIPESKVGETIAGFMRRGRNPTVGTLASQGAITVKIVARARAAAAARRLAARDFASIRPRFGGNLFGTDGDTIEAAVLRVLRRRGETLALAESCTGGLLAKRFTDVPGASGAFLEACVAYGNVSKTRRLGVPPRLLGRQGAVSAGCAAAMAEGIRRTARATWGASITGVAGPGGGTREKPVGLVWIAVSGPGGVSAQELRIKGDRDTIRTRAATAAALALWRRLRAGGVTSARGR